MQSARAEQRVRSGHLWIIFRNSRRPPDGVRIATRISPISA
jgi:hypothetical protein